MDFNSQRCQKKPDGSQGRASEVGNMENLFFVFFFQTRKTHHHVLSVIKCTWAGPQGRGGGARADRGGRGGEGEEKEEERGLKFKA